MNSRNVSKIVLSKTNGVFRKNINTTEQGFKNWEYEMELRICRLKLGICSCTYGLNISSLILYYQKSRTNCTIA